MVVERVSFSAVEWAVLTVAVKVEMSGAAMVAWMVDAKGTKKAAKKVREMVE